MKLTLLLLFSLLCGQGQSQYKNLVFEGAGIRGLAYAGVIKSFEDRDIIAGIEKVGGTSAGAITACLVSIGYKSEEVYDIISSKKFNQFNHGGGLFVGGMIRMKKHYGWYKSKRFENWIGELIEKKTGNPDITFEELYQQGYKDLYLVATCLNKQKMVVLSKETYPKMKVKDGVKISMSIPLYFGANFVDEKGKLHKKKKDRVGTDIMVDGGILGNFPIYIFDDVEESDSSGNEIREYNYGTLGIRIDTDEQIEKDKIDQELVSIDIVDFKSFINSFYVLTIESLNRHQLTDQDWKRTISVSSLGIGPKLKRLSQEQKQNLMYSGEKAVVDYFNHLAQ